MKAKSFFLILSLIALVLLNTKGQGIVHFNTANTSSTLCNNRVTTIVEDSDGIKWFGTQYGVSKYDGMTWTSYTTDDGLIDNRITSASIDTSGNLWFGTYDGISKFDGINFTNYTNAKPVNCITVDSSNNNIWIGIRDKTNMDKSVFRFDGANWTNYTITNKYHFNRSSVRDIAIDKDGDVWVGDWEGVSKFDGAQWTAYYPRGIRGYDVRSIYIDAKDDIWFGDDNDVWKLSDSVWTLYSTEITHDLKFALVHTVTGDNDGNIWAASFRNGLSKFDGTNWTVLNNDSEFPVNVCNAMLFDKQGNEWFGTNGGISIRNNTTWSHLKSNGLSNNNVRSIIEDVQGHKWFGTATGISIYDGNSWINDKDSVKSVSDMAFDSNNDLWIAASNGVFKYDGVNWSHYSEENSQLIANDVLDFAIDKNDNKWFLTSGVVSKLSGTTWTNYETNSQQFPLNYPRSIEIDNINNKWIFSGRSFSRFDSGQWTNYSSVDNSSIENAATDTSGNVWLCTSSNLYKNHKGNWIKYTIQDECKAVAVDKDNNVWISTSNDVIRFDGANWSRFPSDRIFGEESGFSTMHEDSQNNFWFGTTIGAFKIDSAFIADSATAIVPFAQSNTHEVAFNIIGGEVFYGIFTHKAIFLKPIIVKYGYTLSAWYTDTAMTLPWNFASDTLLAPDTLYAKWSTNTYKVKFRGVFEGNIPDITAEFNSLIKEPETPLRKGYTFTGWYKEANHINKWNFATDSVMNIITLYANWTINTYTVKFEDEEGIVLPDTLVTYYTLLKKPAEPVREGYLFLNWYKEPELMNPWDFGKDLILENTILYAKWLKISSAVDEQSISGIHLYPNPAGSTLFLSNLLQKSELFIFSSSGKLMMQSKMKEGESTLDIQELASGTYLFILTNRKENFKGKFIKQ